MSRVVSIGTSSFEKFRVNNAFYVDKTDFIRQWWDGLSDVTAIMRPRRFGKTLAMDMVQCFFSEQYAGRADLFEGLSIWKEERYRSLQGTYPVLFLSFAGVKFVTYAKARRSICALIQELYLKHYFLLESDVLREPEKVQFQDIGVHMSDEAAATSLLNLTDYLSRYHKKKVIVLLDEYDTPLQEAYVNGYWRELVAFLRPLFGTTFKGNPYLERGLMTGITRVSKESIFSDMNNLKMVTTTSEQYEECFGFTQGEVDAALAEFGLSDQRGAVRDWYDGFTFGRKKDIYNPWSITNFLDDRKLGCYWANSSSNTLVSDLLRRCGDEEKADCERLLAGECIEKTIDEEIVFGQLASKRNALWSLLLASGYLKVEGVQADWSNLRQRPVYRLSVTNREVLWMFQDMICDWFILPNGSMAGDEFLDALMRGDVEKMNRALNDMTTGMFSFFDTAGSASEDPGRRPERFYHGFVLGLVAFTRDRYAVHSNRESGAGRYDVAMIPKDPARDDAILLEFKVFDERLEKTLEETAQRALEQIREKGYERDLLEQGIAPEKIRKYGIAFQGKTVLVQGENADEQ